VPQVRAQERLSVARYDVRQVGKERS